MVKAISGFLFWLFQLVAFVCFFWVKSSISQDLVLWKCNAKMWSFEGHVINLSAFSLSFVASIVKRQISKFSDPFISPGPNIWPCGPARDRCLRLCTHVLLDLWVFLLIYLPLSFLPSVYLSTMIPTLVLCIPVHPCLPYTMLSWSYWLYSWLFPLLLDLLPKYVYLDF